MGVVDSTSDFWVSSDSILDPNWPTHDCSLVTCIWPRSVSSDTVDLRWCCHLLDDLRASVGLVDSTLDLGALLRVSVGLVDSPLDLGAL